MQWGSFLEGYQESKDKRETAEAAQRAAQAKKDYERADWIFKQDYQTGQTRAEEIRKEQERERVRKLQRRETLFDKTQTRAHEMMKIDREYMVSTLEKLAATPEGISEDYKWTLVKARVASPAQIDIWNTLGKATREGTRLTGDLTQFNEMMKTHRAGGIIAFPGGTNAFVRMYKPIWHKTIHRDEDINVFAKNFMDDVGKASAKKYAAKPSKNSNRPTGKDDPYEFGKNRVWLPKPFESDASTKPVDEKYAHVRHVRNKFRLIATKIREGKIDPNIQEQYENIESIFEQDRYTRNAIQKRLYPENTKKIEHWTDMEGVAQSGILDALKLPSKNKKPPANPDDNVTVGGDSATDHTPHNQALKKNEKSKPPKPDTTQPPVSAGEAPSVSPTPTTSEIDLMKPRNPNWRDSDIYAPTSPRPGVTTKQRYNKAAKNFRSDDELGYLASIDPEGRAAELQAVAPFEGKEEDKFDFYVGNIDVDGKATGEGAKYAKSYLTSVVARKFQEYARNSDDNSKRNELRDDTDFHKHLLALQKLDPTFDASSALAGAFFKTLATHEHDPNIGPNENQSIELTKDYMYHYLDEQGRVKANVSALGKLQTRLDGSKGMVNAINSVTTILDDRTGGFVAEQVYKVGTVIEVLKKARDEFQSFRTNKDSERRGKDDENVIMLGKFIEKADRVRAGLDEQRADKSISEAKYLTQSLLLSKKIQLAYTLSAQLQGDGTGGGRTISDADFQYALQAVWGPTGKVIRTRLEAIKLSIESKQRRLELYRKYDRSGLSIQVSKFIEGFEASQQAHAQREMLKAMSENVDAEEGSAEAPIVAPTNPKEERRYVDDIHERIMKHNINNTTLSFAELLPRGKNADKDRKFVSHLYSKIIKDYIMRDANIIRAGQEYAKKREIDKGTKPLFVYLDMHKNDKTFREAVDVIAMRLNCSNFEQDNFNIGDSVVKFGEGGKIIISTDRDKSGKTTILKGQVRNDATERQSQNLNRFLMSTAIEIIANSQPR